MSACHARPARPEDAEAVARLVDAAYAVYLARMDRKPAPMLADYAALIARGEVTLLPGPDGPAAILVMRPDGDRLFVENLAVAPALQGRGLGRRLIDFAAERARALGLGEIRLYTNAVMTENLAFYPRLGFEVAGRVSEDGYDRVYFTKRIVEERAAMTPAAARLKALLEAPGLLVMPCCFDALSAKLIEQAGFPLSFMSGFAVAAARLGLPDTGLISYGEMLDQGRNICQAVSIPVIGDGDTGYGNPLNVKRTVAGYAAAGFASVMIEDQVAPKRCGHTRGKAVVERAEALARLRAACDARDEGAGILILARTDARATHGFEEALWRARAFADLGADIVFLEAPESAAEMRAFCAGVAAPAMANMVEQGTTPLLPPAELEEIGYRIAAYPLTLLSSAMRAMKEALAEFKAGRHPSRLLGFEELRADVGFPEYYAAEEAYRA